MNLKLKKSLLKVAYYTLKKFLVLCGTLRISNNAMCKICIKYFFIIKGNKNDRQSAAKMKMYGTLTRDSYEWHPDRVVCKRFNIPDPYPGLVKFI